MTIGNLFSARLIHLIPMGVLMALAVIVRLLDPAPISQLRLNVFDQFLRASPRQADPDFPVRIVAIDEASLEKLGQWPWPRSVIARIVDRLTEAGAKAIVFDVIMAEPDRMSPKALAQAFSGSPQYETIDRLATDLPSHDETLATALLRAPSVLGFSGLDDGRGTLPKAKAAFAAAGDDPAAFVPKYRGAVPSLSILSGAAKGLGAVNWIPDRDLILRRVPLLVSVDGAVYPSLSLEALRVGEGASTILYQGSGGGTRGQAYGQSTGIDMVRLGAHFLPTNKRGEMWIRFAERDERRYISAYQVLENSFDPDLVRGRYVFFGASAAGLLDLRATPLAGAVPGVEVHAQALEQMLSGEHLVRPAYALGFELLFLVGVGCLLAWLIAVVGPLVAAAVGLLAIAVVMSASWLMFKNSGVLVDGVYPSLALAGVYVVGSLSSYVRSERERSRVRAAFSNYVAPQLVAQLADDPSKLKLGGETREVTVLFSDVRQFSKISELMDAAELIAFVNRLFTPLADIILEERGTIDKFMGDAVMAFWNAPVEDADHARQACRAALAMVDRLAELNVEWERDALARGQTHFPVRIGVGLNTGACCVGNVGSPQRFDYSILGDVVNVASRLETVTKTYGAGIIVGERLVEVASGFAFLELDQVVLKGKSEPERIFALLGDESVSASEVFQALEIAHKELQAAVASGNRERGKSALMRCDAIAFPAYRPIGAYFRTVIEKGQAL